MAKKELKTVEEVKEALREEMKRCHQGDDYCYDGPFAVYAMKFQEHGMEVKGVFEKEYFEKGLKAMLKIASDKNGDLRYAPVSDELLLPAVEQMVKECFYKKTEAGEFCKFL